MSGDVQPRKRKDKRKKIKEELDEIDFEVPETYDLKEEDISIHPTSEDKVGTCANVLFILFFMLLAGGVSFICVSINKPKEVDTPLSESRFASVFDGLVEEVVYKEEIPECQASNLEEPCESLIDNEADIDEHEKDELHMEDANDLEGLIEQIIPDNFEDLNEIDVTGIDELETDAIELENPEVGAAKIDVTEFEPSKASEDTFENEIMDVTRNLQVPASEIEDGDSEPDSVNRLSENDYIEDDSSLHSHQELMEQGVSTHGQEESLEQDVLSHSHEEFSEEEILANSKEEFSAEEISENSQENVLPDIKEEFLEDLILSSSKEESPEENINPSDVKYEKYDITNEDDWLIHEELDKHEMALETEPEF